MTLVWVTLLDMSMKHNVTLTLIDDQGRVYVSVTIDGTDHELGTYATTLAAVQRMNAWLAGHGYKWARDTAQRVDRAQRCDTSVLTLAAVPLDYDEDHGHYPADPRHEAIDTDK